MLCSTYDSNTELMKPRIGKKVDFVLLFARAYKNDVAAETGSAKSSYWSNMTM